MRKGTVCILAGLALLLAAAGLAGYNLWDAARADRASEAILAELSIPEPDPEAIPDYQLDPSRELPVETVEQAPFTIEKDGGYYVVSGPAMEQLIDSVNFTDQESLNYFHRTLRSRGVIDALRAAGAKEGDSVVIGDMEFDFVE